MCRVGASGSAGDPEDILALALFNIVFFQRVFALSDGLLRHLVRAVLIFACFGLISFFAGLKGTGHLKERKKLRVRRDRSVVVALHLQ